jgi:hypothetical protein
MPASLQEGAMAIMPWVIFIVGAALFLYSRHMEKKGVIR